VGTPSLILNLKVKAKVWVSATKLAHLYLTNLSSHLNRLASLNHLPGRKEGEVRFLFLAQLEGVGDSIIKELIWVGCHHLLRDHREVRPRDQRHLQRWDFRVSRSTGRTVLSCSVAVGRSRIRFTVHEIICACCIYLILGYLVLAGRNARVAVVVFALPL
jgi:hypothetical protein